MTGVDDNQRLGEDLRLSAVLGIAAFWGWAYARSSSYARFELRARYARPVAIGPQQPGAGPELALRVIQNYGIPLMNAKQLLDRVEAGPSLEGLLGTKHGPYSLCLLPNH